MAKESSLFSRFETSPDAAEVNVLRLRDEHRLLQSLLVIPVMELHHSIKHAVRG
jgi:hypothetical protein